MGRLRTNGRGKRIYWRSPTMYHINLSSTNTSFAIGPGPSQDLQTFPRYAGRSPLFIQGFWINSSENSVGDYVVRFLINNTLVYTESGITGLTADTAFNVPIPIDEKIKLLQNDQYEIQMRDVNNVDNEVEIFAYGYYYIFDDKILYSSCQMNSFNNPNTFSTNFVWRNVVLGNSLLCEDFNQIFITHIGVSMSNTTSSQFQAQVFNVLEDGTQLNTSLTEVFAVSDTDEHIIPLITPFWLKPGHFYGWDTRDVLNNGTQDPTCRLIGYRRQQEGKYGFSGYSNYFKGNMGLTIPAVTAFTRFARRNYGAYWPLTRTIGLNGCANNSLIISNNTLFINTNQASDTTDLTDLDITANRESSATWTRNPASGYSSYLEYPNRYGMEVAVQAGSSGGEYYTRHIMQVVL